MICWTWDPAKAAVNLRKHRVSFKTAAQVLEDPFVLVHPDPHEDADRWRATGRPTSGSHVILIVIHTEPRLVEGRWVGRIISARRADRQERTSYEEGQPPPASP